MSTLLNLLADDILPDHSVVPICLVEDDASHTITKMVKHLRDDGALMKRQRKKAGHLRQETLSVFARGAKTQSIAKAKMKEEGREEGS